jgi:GNAT superfamily N-acetyltransferase
VSSDLRVLALPAGIGRVDVAAGVDARAIADDDLADLAVLYLDSYPPEIGAEDLPAAVAELDATFAGDYGELRRDASFIAFRDGVPAGAVFTTRRSIWDEGLEGPFVIDLFVAPAHRGHGIGRALMLRTIAACEATADRMLALRVGSGTSPAAHRLYGELGFTVQE